MKYYLYILKSLVDNNSYVGITQNIQKRLAYHNEGRVNSTKHRVPFKMIYTEEYSLRKEAREREKYLKSYKGYKKKREIINTALSSNG